MSVDYAKQDLHYFMDQSRPEGLSDQQSTGPRFRFVSISEIVQEESKNPELEENKDIFEDEGYNLSEEEQMTKAQKVAQKKADKEKRYQRVEILHSLEYSTAQINSRGFAGENEQRYYQEMKIKDSSRGFYLKI